MTYNYIYLWQVGWWVSLLLIPLAIYLCLKGWRGKLLDRHRLCRQCGYDLHGLELPLECPECGKPNDIYNAKVGHRTRHKPMLVTAVVLGACAWAGLWGFGQLYQTIRNRPFIFSQAIRQGDLAKVDSLLAVDPQLAIDWSKARYPGYNNRYPPALHALIFGPQRAVFDRIMQEPIDVNAAEDGDHGSTLLGRAILINDQVLVRELLLRGADPNVQTGDMNGETPLQLELLHRQSGASMQLLLQHGADPNATDADGLAALHFVGKYGPADPDAVKRLIAAGADVNQRDNQGRTPLHWMARFGQYSNLTPMLEAGADLLSRDDDGRLPGESLNDDRDDQAELMEVWWKYIIKPLCDKQDWRELKRMLDATGNCKQWRGREGGSLLHLAVFNGRPDAVRFLLDYGIDPEVKTNADDQYRPGFTALHWAAKQVERESVKILLEAGADPAALDADGLTPAERAMESNARKVAAMIKSYRDDEAAVQ